MYGYSEYEDDMWDEFFGVIFWMFYVAVVAAVVIGVGFTLGVWT